MSASKAYGTSPLVCVVCEQVVGAINTEALAQMFINDEAYICHVCEEVTTPNVKARLAATPYAYYMQLVGRAMVAAELVDGRQ
jgi:hypothetical protein